MLEAVRVAAAHLLHVAGHWPAYRRFRAALDRPAEVQAARLRQLLARNANSEYGRRLAFARLRTVADYQAAVPVVDYEALRPAVEAIMDGRPRVLTVDPVRVLETTGGSTGAVKHIPYTTALLREFQQAVGAWMVDLARGRPELACGRAYWSVSPLARAREVTRGGLPVGFADDAQYFGRLERWVLGQLLATPADLGRVPEVETSRYVTLRFLLDVPDLTFVSVWSPSFLMLLVAPLDEWAVRLIGDVEAGTLTPPAPLPAVLAQALARRLRPHPSRARELRALLCDRGALRPTDVWPRLRLISSWTSAAAARFLPALYTRFPGVEVQGKGLLATEGVVSVPLFGHPGAAVAVTAHFYEFVPAHAPEERPRLVHELEPGQTYTVLLTTGGGLYRYALGDAVTVVGCVRRTPLVEFVGRTGGVSDLCGEKLSEAYVGRVLEEVARRFDVAPAFLMLAPEWGEPPSYALFLGGDRLGAARVAALADAVESELQKSPSYAYCRTLGQLGSARGYWVTGDAAAAYARRCERLGQRAGAIKPTYLHRTAGWREHLPAVPVR